MKPQFLNVDLEIRSKAKLDSLAAEMGARVLVLYCGPEQKRNLLAVESAREHKGPDATIHALCTVVETLSPTTRRIWRSAEKVFDIGYELLPLKRSFHFTLSPDTLQRVAKLGGTLAVTYYQRDNNKSRTPVKPLRAKVRRRSGVR